MRDALTTLARQLLPQVAPAERAAALRSLKKLIDEELCGMALGGGPERADSLCPRCGSQRVARKGHDPDGSQRHLCRSCRRTLTPRTNRMFAATKLDRATWMRFAECRVDALPLREAAERCGASLNTAFLMRRRVLERPAQNTPAFRGAAGDGMEIYELCLRESFKGNGKNAACGIPGKARHQLRAINQYERVCVLAGINDAGDFFFEIAGRGNVAEERAARCLEGRVASGAIVATGGAKAYRRPLRPLDVRRHDERPSGEHAISRVNPLHGRIVEFAKGFHGVAARRPWNYLAWFKWMWSFRRRRGAGQTASLIVKQVGAAAYRTTWRNYKRTPYPFCDYWVRQAGWDETARAALPLAMGAVSKAG